MFRTLLPMALLFLIVSCSSSDATEDDIVTTNSELVTSYDYDAIEVKLLEMLNEHRRSLGLNPLQTINHISYKSEEHNEYMIKNNVVNHDHFAERSQNLMQVLGAKTVSENVAYSYATPVAAFNAWMKSPEHRANIEGNFTHFGISVRQGENGKKYYTNMFIKV